jgi:hypothetical protein
MSFLDEERMRIESVLAAPPSVKQGQAGNGATMWTDVLTTAMTIGTTASPPDGLTDLNFEPFIDPVSFGWWNMIRRAEARRAYLPRLWQ